jgi:hypothetical protein
MKIFRYVKFLIALWSLRGEALALWKKIQALNLDESNGVPELDFKASVKTLLSDAPKLVTADGKVITFGGISGKGITP